MITERRSGIELLRIVAMLQIITLHAFNFGELTKYADSADFIMNFSADLIWSLCRSPVNVFIIITGYFLVQSEFNLHKTASRIWSLYKVMLFYSIVLSAVAFTVQPDILFNSANGPAGEILKAIFPFTSRTWYFMTLFIILSALIPFINLAVSQLTKKQYLILLAVVFSSTSLFTFFTDLFPTNLWMELDEILDTNGGKSLYSFIFMYLIGGYIRRFVKIPDKSGYRYLVLYLVLCLSDFAFNLISGTQGNYNDVFGDFSNPIVVFESIFIFMFFASMKFSNRFINKIASAVFAVYIIHEFKYVREFIWSQINFMNFKGNVGECILYLTAVVLVIFAICTVIELTRASLSKLIKNIVDGKKKPQILNTV